MSEQAAEEYRRQRAIMKVAKGGITRNINSIRRVLDSSNFSSDVVKRHVDALLEHKATAERACERVVAVDPDMLYDVDRWLDVEFARIDQIIEQVEAQCDLSSIRDVSGDSVKGGAVKDGGVKCDVAEGGTGSARTGDMRQTMVKELGVDYEEKTKVGWCQPPETDFPDSYSIPTNVNPQPQQMPSLLNWCYGKSLPKLSLPHFDGDPLKWSDWSGLFLSMIDAAPMSKCEKLTHLQQAVTGRAKAEIVGFGYSGEMYEAAFRALESRFGKRQFVVRAHLDKLGKVSKVDDENRNTVFNLAATVKAIVLTFEKLGYEGDLTATSNSDKVFDRLSERMKFRWASHLAKHNIDKPNLRIMNEWLQMQVRTYEWLPSGTSKSQKFTGATSAVNTAKNAPKCPLGDGEHSLVNCPQFLAMSVAQRYDAVQKHRLCMVCFSRTHWIRNCRAKRCGEGNCRKNHHALLHRSSEGPAAQISDSTASAQSQSQSEHAGTGTAQRKLHVLLQVVPIRLHGPAGSVDSFAMLDMGSTCSLLCKSIADELGLIGETHQLDLSGIRERTLLTSSKVDVSLSSCQGSKRLLKIKGVWVVDKLNLPEISIDMSQEKNRWSHLNDLELPSVQGGKVQMLIGSDAIDVIQPLEMRSGPKGAPFAINTPLGWTVVGPTNSVVSSNSESIFRVDVVPDPDTELNRFVKDWWTTESFGCLYDIKNPKSIEDKRAIEIMEKTTKKVNNRYQTGVLWKDSSHLSLSSNYVMAEHRFESLERRLCRDLEFKTAYDQNVASEVEKGFSRTMVPGEIDVEASGQWFLPHHPVINPNKPGKLRKVFDAAARWRGVSLNDCLVTGPNLLKPLIGVLMRFREKPIGLCSDIEGMYSQVLIPEVDLPFFRYLYRESPDMPLTVYQYQRHIFGAKSSPTSAIYALQRTAIDHQDLYPDAARLVLDDFYMDDNLSSVDCVTEAIQIQRDLVALLKLGGFRLTKWCSNSAEVLQQIPPEELAHSKSLKDNQNGTDRVPERVLGVKWCTDSDSFVFGLKARDAESEVRTPRQLLSTIAAIYDPLGVLAPVTLTPKLMMQQIWREGLKWDTELSDEKRLEFNDWVNDLSYLKYLSIPRFYRQIGVTCPWSVQLHVKVDASERAFSACAYFRFAYSDGRITCRFVLGKSRVAPLKPLTIPKLELQSAVLGVRLAQTILKEHRYEVSETHYWSDSTTVLQWIRDTKGRHPTFIASRVAEILDFSTPEQWHHVPGKVNVADDGSRGLTADRLTESCRWLNGPAFLLLTPDKWPELPVPEPETNLAMSSDAQVSAQTSSNDEAHQTPVIDINRFSSWNRLWRSTAWVLRFIWNCRARKGNVARRTGSLSVEEKELSEQLLFRTAQAASFAKELACLNSGKRIPRQSRLKGLSPFIDADGLLRSGGRIGKADVKYSVKYPILLDNKSHLTELLIFHHHVLHHEGIEYLRSELRQRFWILKSRSIVRKVAHKCRYCRKRNAMPKSPIMGNLPDVRVTAHKPPFYATGVDYFGPFYVRKFRRVEKRYGCLFVCLATKAIHLEVSHSLDTDSFIMALRRFIGRRGHPKVIASDNGTNFVGAQRELRDCIENWNQDQIKDALLQKNIEWRFNPPAAPHFGGLWERLVGSVKRTMSAILAKRQLVLTDEVLHTVLVEAEALLNSRPLTPVSDDIADLDALTPNHFLLGRASVCLPPDVFYEQDISSRRRWRHAQILTEHFWKRWLREYLPTLNERKRWWDCMGRIALGDLVLVVDPNQPRGNWLLGRVVKVFPGDDGKIRVVELRTKFGSLRRHVVKLAKLSGD